jgi:hypothetical protein
MIAAGIPNADSDSEDEHILNMRHMPTTNGPATGAVTLQLSTEFETQLAKQQEDQRVNMAAFRNELTQEREEQKVQPTLTHVF